MASRPLEIIDATGIDFVTRDRVRAPWSLGIMGPEDIVASRLKNKQRTFSRSECDAATIRLPRALLRRFEGHGILRTRGHRAPVVAFINVLNHGYDPARTRYE